MRYMIREALRTVLIPAVCFLAIAPVCMGRQKGAAHPEHARKQLKHRWFFSFGYGRNRKDVEKIKSLIDVAAGHGLNGMVLSSFGLDSVTRWNEKDIALLKEVAEYCDKKNIELIPTGFSAGYGGGALGYNRSFAACLPTTLSLNVRNGRIVPNSYRNLMQNGDLEEHRNDRFKGYGFHDKPGVVSFADTRCASGKSSIRFEKFGDFQHGHGRINQKVVVAPGRTYRLTFKIKTESLQPVAGLKAMVYAEGESLASIQPNVKPTQDWTKIALEYINRDRKEVVLYIGIWGGKSGKFWVDDIKFSQSGDLSNIVRRKGAPLVLKSKDRDVVFAEGKDFREIRCMNQLGSIGLGPGSSIKANERLELSCYKIPYVNHSWGKQISLCMSNPELYEYWEKEAGRLYEIIKFKRYLLAMDEIRNGGGCLTCRSSGKSLAEILGACFTRQRGIFKALDPRIEVITWSDMIDPAHNARDNYYGVVGDYTGAWKHVPRDLIIMCWYHRIRDKSLGFFSRHGFRTYGAAYYDADDLTNPKEWIDSLSKTPNARGIMYTTWEKKYRLLAGFGDLVSGITAGQKKAPDKK